MFVICFQSRAFFNAIFPTENADLQMPLLLNNNFVTHDSFRLGETERHLIDKPNEYLQPYSVSKLCQRIQKYAHCLESGTPMQAHADTPCFSYSLTHA